MRVLAVTKIFPNAAEPLSAPFNRQQFAALGALCQLDVLATIPWYPGSAALARWSSAGRLAAVPRHEIIDGLAVAHPRTLFLPRIAHALWGPLYAASLAPEIARWRGRCDVVLGSWAYPDGFAAILLARALGVPSVVKLHGSDVNVIAQMPGPRFLMKHALPRAARVVAVSRALADAVIALGVDPARVALVGNGVDAALFRVRDRAEARAALGLPAAGDLLLYVGNLKETKGVIDLAEAFAQLVARRPGTRLAIVGGGEARAWLDAIAARAGDAILLAGPRPLAEIPTWMAASDMVVLASWAEGTPNVLLEALSCGRRVVATAVGGIPDVVSSELLGELVPPRDREALAAALERGLDRRYDPVQVARAGGRGGWAESARALHAVLEAAAAER